MSTAEFGSLCLVLAVILGLAHLLGHLFTRLHQPKVIGEILAGLLLGPTVLGRLAPHLSITAALNGSDHASAAALGFLYNLGLLLLMFVSGAETKHLFHNNDRRELTWLGGIGTGLPFVLALLCAPFIPTGPMMGPANQRISLLLVIGIAVSVTSIPVISRILRDLGIFQTRFTRLVLGVAVCEDILLWALLALAVSLARSGDIPGRAIALHTFQTLAYLLAGLFLMPRMLRKINHTRWNPLISASPIGYICLVLLAYSALAAVLDVSFVFAAFLAGFALAQSTDALQQPFEDVAKTSFAIFIPIYFALVGCRLDLGNGFSVKLLLVFLAVACLVKLVSAGAGARLAGFDWLASANLSIALNARGGPGIVLASVAYEAGIVNSSFYTTLVLVALITSQFAGAWLDFVLRRGWPLLGQETAPVLVQPGWTAPDQIAA
jgi:Kef-type K+ transport system membrane component KefB